MSLPHQSRITDIRSTTLAEMDVLLTSEQFNRFRDLLASYGGVFLDAAQRRVLEQGLAKRLSLSGGDLENYEQLLCSPAGRPELQRLIELVLNHETFFFRNGPHLRALREVLLQEMHQRKPNGLPIRIWSAGCASGEEVYSLAIVALETLGRPLVRPVEIIGTDLSETALQRARTGFYRGRALNNVPAEILERYFTPQNDGFLVNDTLRSLVRFVPLNLLEPFPDLVQRVDAIFCQNVTIYFQDATRRALIERFYTCLPPGGMLFLGFSETLWNVFDGFHSREVSGAYVYYKESLVQRAVPQSRNQLKSLGEAPPRAAGRARAVQARVPRSAKPAERQEPPKAVSVPATDERTLHVGRELIDRGQTHEALDTLRRIPPQSPLATQAMNLAARAHADRGDLELAAAEVRRVLEIDTLNDEAYLLLGVIYSRQQQWQLAVQQLERARYLKPEAALVSFYLAAAYHQLGRGEPAAREYRSALWKLRSHPPDELLDGVAVGWLRETCQRQLATVLQMM